MFFVVVFFFYRIFHFSFIFQLITRKKDPYNMTWSRNQSIIALFDSLETYFFLKYIAVVTRMKMSVATRWHARDDSLSLSAQKMATVNKKPSSIHPKNLNNERNLKSKRLRLLISGQSKWNESFIYEGCILDGKDYTSPEQIQNTL